MSFLLQATTGLVAFKSCRMHGLFISRYYLWPTKFAGMNVPVVERLKELEATNALPKRLMTEQMLENKVTKEGLRKKWRAHQRDVNPYATWSATG